MSELAGKIDTFQQDLQSLSLEALKDEEARKKLFGVVMLMLNPTASSVCRSYGCC